MKETQTVSHRESYGTHDLKELLVGKSPIALAIDAGSSRLKISLFDIRKLAHLKDEKTSVLKTDYTGFERRERKFARLGDFKWVDGNALGRTIHDNIFKLLHQNGIPDFSTVILTGRSNNLVVSHTQGEKTRHIILTDDPSLQSKDYTPRQKRLFKRLIPDFKVKEGLKPNSSIMKLVTFKNHPELIEYLFGAGVKFSDLRFNSYLGYIAEILSGDRNAKAETRFSHVPINDLAGFAGYPDADVTQVEKLMRGIGVNTRKIRRISFAQEDLILEKHANEPTLAWYTTKDLNANAYLIEHCIKHMTPESKRLPADAFYIETDSVGKVIFFPTTEEDKNLGRAVGGLRYLVQRITGNVNVEIKRLYRKYLPTDRDSDFYTLVNDILNRRMDEPNNPYFYFPDLGIGLGYQALLVKKTPAGYVKIDLGEINPDKMGRKELDKIARAMVRGVCFGLREKAEKIYKVRNQMADPTFFIYGGIAHNSLAWRNTFAQCLPGKVLHLQLPNACIAALFKLAKERELADPHVISRFKLTYNQVRKPALKREEEYQKWQKLKEQARTRGEHNTVLFNA